MNFLKHMNMLAYKQLTQTFFGNVHGLNNTENRSSAYDIAKLCCLAMKFPLF